MRFIEDWVSGSATCADYSAGTEGVRLQLIDSAVVEMQDVYRQFNDTQLSRTDFRAVLDGLLRAIMDDPGSP
jgi:hypothetical protein